MRFVDITLEKNRPNLHFPVRPGVRNTRFNPTGNGRLHLGHAYMILINEGVAKASGGTFIVRIEDDCPFWLRECGQKQIEENVRGIKEDLAWLGVDAPVLLQSEYSLLRPAPDENDNTAIYPNVMGGRVLYPYVPEKTAKKVQQDYQDGCNCLIRGDELLTEFSLYAHFCCQYGYPIPEFYYLPHLQYQGRTLTDVSKTQGNFKLCDLREAGHSPDKIKSLLALSCLIDPDLGWLLDNVKSQLTFLGVE